MTVNSTSDNNKCVAYLESTNLGQGPIRSFPGLSRQIQDLGSPTSCWMETRGGIIILL